MSGLDSSVHGVSSRPVYVEAPTGATWPAGASAPAGLSRHGEPWTEEEMQRVRQHVRDGKGTPWIANAMGRTREGIYALVKRKGFGPVQRKSMTWTVEAVRTLIRMRMEGAPWKETTPILGCNQHVAAKKWRQVRRLMISKGHVVPDLNKVQAARRNAAIKQAWENRA